jgi:hypothetical protein
MNSVHAEAPRSTRSVAVDQPLTVNAIPATAKMSADGITLDRYGHVDAVMREGTTAGCRTANARKKPAYQSRFPRVSDFLVIFSEPDAKETLLGRMDSNHRMQDSKSRALPLGDAPMLV